MESVKENERENNIEMMRKLVDLNNDIQFGVYFLRGENEIVYKTDTLYLDQEHALALINFFIGLHDNPFEAMHMASY